MKELGPLLINQAVDIASLTSVWKSTVSSIHAGDTDRLPGYYDGTLNYWDGRAWENDCRERYRKQMSRHPTTSASSFPDRNK